MPMVLNEEQRLLKRSIKSFLQTNAPIKLMRQIRDQKDNVGYSQTVWQQLLELGVISMALPEKYGGLGFGYLGLGAVLEEMGRTLTASPLFASVVLGAAAIALGGSEEQKSELLPQIAAGDLLLALAIDEGQHFRPEQTATQLTKSGDALVLNGTKTFVLDGHTANRLLVVSRSSGQPGDNSGISLVLLAADTAGVTISRTHLMDGRNAATIAFDNVSVSASQLIGSVDQGMATLQAVIDRGAICMAAEMLGGARETFERTIAFLNERKQFGVKIGSFQALQHRAANLFCEIEACKSVVLDALSEIDVAHPNLSAKVSLSSKASLAKTLANDCYQHVTNEAVQLHGGMGVTDELDIGLFLKRARVCTQIMGDSRYHKNRYASLQGY